MEAETQRRGVPDPIAPADFLSVLLSSRKSIPSDRDFLNRIAQVAYERYTARRVTEDVPTIIIVSTPLTRRQTSDLLGDRLNYVMIFGAETIYFQDTVHAFAVDSYCPGGVNVLGAHMDWLSSDGRSVERAIVVDETGLVKEVAFENPVPIHVVQILHLPLKRERQIHRELAAHFRDRSIPQINPFSSSERADDKAWSHALWGQCERKIVSPKYALISQHSSPEAILERLRLFIENTQKPDVVVQPNRGTEGYKVEKFDGALSPIVKYIKDQILPEDDAIVRERRGNVRYSRSFLNVAFRVNVAWNGSEFVAESGYAQVAKDDRTFLASRGRGGSIVDINEALANLYYPRDGRWIRLILTDEDIAAMKTAAVNAVYGLNVGLNEVDYLKLMGVDILLEVEEHGNIIPVVLEANPRPAGLSHSTEIIGISDKKPQPRISTEIFRFVVSKT